VTLSVGNSSVQLRLAANAVAPVSLTFVGPVMVRAAGTQARPHRLQLEEFALFRLVHEQGVSFRALIITDGTLRVLPVGQENTGKKPIVLLDGNLKERVGSEGVPIILDAGAIRTLGQGESLVS
jgi:hypothetical protein